MLYSQEKFEEIRSHKKKNNNKKVLEYSNANLLTSEFRIVRCCDRFLLVGTENLKIIVQYVQSRLKLQGINGNMIEVFSNCAVQIVNNLNNKYKIIFMRFTYPNKFQG